MVEQHTSDGFDVGVETPAGRHVWFHFPNRPNDLEAEVAAIASSYDAKHEEEHALLEVVE